MKEKADILDFMKIFQFCAAKGINSVKRQPAQWEKVCVITYTRD